jgi:hypothetical protein
MSARLPQTLQKYDDLFLQFPADATAECHPLDYDSYFRAQKSKSYIQQLNSLDVRHPNFAGHYLLLMTGALFEKIWLIADCQTGKFLPSFITGNASFGLNSQLVLLTESGDFPKLMVLRNGDWVQIADPIQNKSQKISNDVAGDEAKTFFLNLPNPDHDQVLPVSELACTWSSAEPRPTFICTVKNREGKPAAISPDQNRELGPLVQKWGTQKPPSGADSTEKMSRIETAKCKVANAKYSCDLVTTAF